MQPRRPIKTKWTQERATRVKPEPTWRGYTPRNEPMGEAPLAIPANYSGGRPYSGFMRYNTSSDRIYMAKGQLNMTAANTAVTQQVNLPIQIMQDGTAIIPEILKCIIVINPPENIANANQDYRRAIFSVFTGDTGGNELASTNNLFQFDFVQWAAFTAAGTFRETIPLQFTQDISDGAGHGFLVSEKITARYTTVQYTSASDCDYCIVYKLKQVSTGLFASLAQAQRERVP